MRTIAPLFLLYVLLGVVGCDAFGNYIASHSGPSCSQLTHGSGSWWACNVRTSAADPVPVPTYQAEPGACGVLVCEPDGADPRADIIARLFKGKDQPTLECRKGGDSPGSIQPTWTICLDPDPQPADCLGDGEEGCAPEDGPRVPCCEPFVCDDFAAPTGKCCHNEGAACETDAQCCTNSLGCVDGFCGCTPLGAPCDAIGGSPYDTTCCSAALCQGGVCCFDQGEPCDKGADCCSGSCSLNVCD